MKERAPDTLLHRGAQVIVGGAMKCAWALIPLFGCATVPDVSFIDPPIRVSTNDQGAVVVIGSAFELDFAATGTHLPERLLVNNGRVDLFGARDICPEDEPSRVGILVKPAIQASAGGPGDGPPPEILWAGPAVARIRVSYEVPYNCSGSQILAGSSVFTVFPKGRIVREDSDVAPSTTTLTQTGPCECQQTTLFGNLDFFFSSFWAFQGSGSSQVDESGNPIDATDSENLFAGCTMYSDRTVGVSWTQEPGTKTRYFRNDQTSSHSLYWPTERSALAPDHRWFTSTIAISDLHDCGSVLDSLVAKRLSIDGAIVRLDRDGIYRDTVRHTTAFDVVAGDQSVPAGFVIAVDLAGADHATISRSDAMPVRVVVQRETGSQFLFAFLDELLPGERVTIEPHS